jgi:hypothetical protein
MFSKQCDNKYFSKLERKAPKHTKFLALGTEEWFARESFFKYRKLSLKVWKFFPFYFFEIIVFSGWNFKSHICMYK